MDVAIASRCQQTGSQEFGVLCGYPQCRPEYTRFVLPFLMRWIQTVGEKLGRFGNGVFAEG